MIPPPLPPTQPDPGARQQNSGLALASLILGVVGIVLCLGPFTGIPAVICGHKAQSQIRNSGGRLGGNGLAIAGLITGYIAIFMIFVMGMLAAIAIPNFIKARQAAQKNVCVGNMRKIEGARDNWKLDSKKEANAIPSDAELYGADKYLESKPVCPAGGAYSISGSDVSCSVHGALSTQ